MAEGTIPGPERECREPGHLSGAGSATVQFPVFAFTTFSTWMVETGRLLGGDRYAAAASNPSAICSPVWLLPAWA
ncbi:hypothetical protein [Streptomyces sp. NPDC000880]